MVKKLKRRWVRDKIGSRWVRLLSYATRTVNQELLLQNEYLAAENLILRGKLPSRMRLSDRERTTLAEIGKHLVCGPLGSAGLRDRGA
jgi:hypothetical protein